MYRAKMKKASNRDRILECVMRNAPVSRTMISELTEITPATTTAIVTALLEEGALQELSARLGEDNGIGRKRIALDICAKHMYAIGVEFTQKALCVCLSDLKGNILQQRIMPFDEGWHKAITGTIIAELSALLQHSGIQQDKVCGIGIAVPGHMDIVQNKLLSSADLWHSFDADKIRSAFNIPLHMENNVRCMALAQYLFSPEHSPDSFAYFHVGMGMFCANIIDGELLLGNAYMSGEVGHTIVVPDGVLCECGKHGCLETVASERCLLQNAHLLYDYNASSVLRHLADSKANITMEHIATAYAMGDEAVAQNVDTALKYLGIAISNLAIIMNPEKIFLHGQMFNYPKICSELMDIVNRQLLFVDSSGGGADTMEILPALPIDGAVGGAALAVARCFLSDKA